MVIAIDLDGVVFDSEEYFRTYAHLYDIKHVKNGLFDKQSMDMKLRHGWDSDITDDFFEKYTEEILDNAPLKPGAKYVLDELKKQGHKLICITLRGYYRQCEKDVTVKRVKEENLPFDKILYSQKNKLISCQTENVDLIIDDNPNTIELLSTNNIKCLHFRGMGLKKVENQNVTEVQNWAQIYEYIQKIQEAK